MFEKFGTVEVNVIAKQAIRIVENYFRNKEIALF